MAGAVLCHPSGPHPACRATDAGPSRPLDRPTRRVCGAPSERLPRPGSDVAGLSTSRRPHDDVLHYAPSFSINEYLCPTGRAVRESKAIDSALAAMTEERPD